VTSLSSAGQQRPQAAANGATANDRDVHHPAPSVRRSQRADSPASSRGGDDGSSDRVYRSRGRHSTATAADCPSGAAERNATCWHVGASIGTVE
jgi:hypothetical protein